MRVAVHLINGTMETFEVNHLENTNIEFFNFMLDLMEKRGVNLLEVLYVETVSDAIFQ